MEILDHVKATLLKHSSSGVIQLVSDTLREEIMIPKNDFMLVWAKYNYERPVVRTELLTIC